MASNDALIARTVQDARSASPYDEVALKHVLDEIHQIKTLDKGDSSRLKSDYGALSTRLHQEGLLPGLVITDSNSGSVTVTGSDGKVQRLDSHSFGKSLEYQCRAPLPYDPTVGDQNPAYEEIRCLKEKQSRRVPYAKPV
ncbi:hypothetical protein BH10CYA1_BH10CYA1_44310 [soil metagenome]